MKQVVITVHGIRTFGHWQQRLAAQLRNEKTQIVCYNYTYGYFSVIAFLIPPLRWLVTRRFRRELEEITARHSDARIDVVAHSFGTHFVAWGLLGIPSFRRPKLHTIILAGSVLRESFRWSELIHSGSVKRLVNECGISDSVLALNQVVVLFTGMAGRFGFAGMTGEAFINRFHRGGHSLYFEKNGMPDEVFMREKWLPLLLGDDHPNQIDERNSPSPLQGIVITLLQNAEPIKLAVYLLLLTFPIWGFTNLYYRLRVSNLRTNMQLAAFIESYRNFGHAVITFQVPADRAQIRADDQMILKQVTDFLNALGYTGSILLVGHTTRNGTEEYNLALGERCAMALREYLVEIGIPAERIKTLSMGKDDPALNYENDGYKPHQILPLSRFTEDFNNRVSFFVFGEKPQRNQVQNVFESGK